MSPARVLRLAVIGWGLGDLALGRRAIGLAWLASEVAGAAGVALLTLAYADTSWYLLPFLAGAAFLAAWAAQAALAYRTAQARSDAEPAGHPGRGSPAAALAWLSVPLLAWGTGFWLVAADSASPGAVVDRFVGDWVAVVDGTGQWEAGLALAPEELTRAARDAVRALADRCPECESAAELLRGVRVRLVEERGGTATAVVELVRYQRHPSSFLGVFATSELVPVPVAEVLRLDLEARAAPYGGERWHIASARTP